MLFRQPGIVFQFRLHISCVCLNKFLKSHIQVSRFFHTEMPFPLCCFPFGLKSPLNFPAILTSPVIIVKGHIPCSPLFVFVRRHNLTPFLIRLCHAIKFFFIVFFAHSSGDCDKTFCFQFFVHLPHQLISKWFGNA